MVSSRIPFKLMQLLRNCKVFGGIALSRSNRVTMMSCLFSGMGVVVFHMSRFVAHIRIFMRPYRQKRAGQRRCQVRQHKAQTALIMTFSICAEARVGGTHRPPGAKILTPSPQCRGRSMWEQDIVDSPRLRRLSVPIREHARELKPPPCRGKLVSSATLRSQCVVGAAPQDTQQQSPGVAPTKSGKHATLSSWNAGGWRQTFGMSCRTGCRSTRCTSATHWPMAQECFPPWTWQVHTKLAGRSSIGALADGRIQHTRIYDVNGGIDIINIYQKGWSHGSVAEIAQEGLGSFNAMFGLPSSSKSGRALRRHEHATSFLQRGRWDGSSKINLPRCKG